jgi:NADP-dependent 3-hydroxy acid dehydrogenase YdfG
MSRLVIVTGKVNPIGEAVAKASLNRANKSVVIDAKRDDLPLTRMKPQ